MLTQRKYVCPKSRNVVHSVITLDRILHFSKTKNFPQINSITSEIRKLNKWELYLDLYTIIFIQGKAY
jgi:hypothetical protein